MVNYDTKGQFVSVTCDKCHAPNPPLADLIINHGLNGLGWDCKGGKHICPTCKPSE